MESTYQSPTLRSKVLTAIRDLRKRLRWIAAELKLEVCARPGGVSLLGAARMAFAVHYLLFSHLG